MFLSQAVRAQPIPSPVPISDFMRPFLLTETAAAAKGILEIKDPNNTEYGAWMDAVTDESPSLHVFWTVISGLSGGHDAVTVADTNSIDFTLDGQLISADVNETWLSGLALGDMLKSDYDVLEDGYIDGNDTTYSSAMNGNINAPSSNVMYDYLHQIDTDDDGDVDSVDPDLFLSAADANEWIQDEAGSMFSGNTETGATVTYQDDDGTVDIVVDVRADSSTTFTNKTIDADGTGNVISNIDEDNCKDGSDLLTGAIEFLIDGGGSAITTGIKGDLEIPCNCTIKRVTALADQSGSIVVDLWVDSYANYPATDADTITSSTPVTISSATKSQDSTLTSWTTSLTDGDILRWNVDSCTTITRCTVSILCEK